MPKEIRVSAVLEVPDDIWEQSDRMAEAKPIVLAFQEAIAALGGKVEVELVTPKPRADKGDPAAQYVAAGGKLPA